MSMQDGDSDNSKEDYDPLAGIPGLLLKKRARAKLLSGPAQGWLTGQSTEPTTIPLKFVADDETQSSAKIINSEGDDRLSVKELLVTGAEEAQSLCLKEKDQGTHCCDIPDLIRSHSAPDPDTGHGAITGSTVARTRVNLRHISWPLGSGEDLPNKEMSEVVARQPSAKGGEVFCGEEVHGEETGKGDAKGSTKGKGERSLSDFGRKRSQKFSTDSGVGSHESQKDSQEQSRELGRSLSRQRSVFEDSPIPESDERKPLTEVGGDEESGVDAAENEQDLHVGAVGGCSESEPDKPKMASLPNQQINPLNSIDAIEVSVMNSESFNGGKDTCEELSRTVGGNEQANVICIPQLSELLQLHSHGEDITQKSMSPTLNEATNSPTIASMRQCFFVGDMTQTQHSFWPITDRANNTLKPNFQISPEPRPFGGSTAPDLHVQQSSSLTSPSAPPSAPAPTQVAPSFLPSAPTSSSPALHRIPLGDSAPSDSDKWENFIKEILREQLPTLPPELVSDFVQRYMTQAWGTSRDVLQHNLESAAGKSVREEVVGASGISPETSSENPVNQPAESSQAVSQQTEHTLSARELLQILQVACQCMRSDCTDESCVMGQDLLQQLYASLQTERAHWEPFIRSILCVLHQHGCRCIEHSSCTVPFCLFFSRHCQLQFEEVLACLHKQYLHGLNYDIETPTASSELHLLCSSPPAVTMGPAGMPQQHISYQVIQQHGRFNPSDNFLAMSLVEANEYLNILRMPHRALDVLVDLHSQDTISHIIQHLWAVRNPCDLVVFQKYTGTSLDEYLQEHPHGLGLWQTWNILEHVLRGASFLLSQDVLFLNWQAAAITIGSDRVCLTDFSRAIKVTPELTTLAVHNCRTTLNPLIIAPEMFQGVVRLGRTDSWGVGLVAMEISTGKMLYHDLRHLCGEEARQQVEQVQRTQGTCPHVSDELLGNFLQHCLKIDPSQRVNINELLALVCESKQLLRESIESNRGISDDDA